MWHLPLAGGCAPSEGEPPSAARGMRHGPRSRPARVVQDLGVEQLGARPHVSWLYGEGLYGEGLYGDGPYGVASHGVAPVSPVRVYGDCGPEAAVVGWEQPRAGPARTSEVGGRRCCVLTAFPAKARPLPRRRDRSPYGCWRHPQGPEHGARPSRRARSPGDPLHAAEPVRAPERVPREPVGATEPARARNRA